MGDAKDLTILSLAKARRRKAESLNHKEHEEHKANYNAIWNLDVIFVPFVSFVVITSSLRLGAFA